MCNVVQLCLAASKILLMRKWKHAFLHSRDRSCVKMADRFAGVSRRYSLKNKLGDQMIKQLLNSVIPNIVICQCLADQLFASAFGLGKYIIDLLATDKSRYFCWTSSNNCCKYRTWMYRGLKQCSIECKKVISWLYTFIGSFVVSGSVIGQKNSRATFSANREQI